ncbi:hypothetical protein [Klebsiella pneumoniae]|uniref:Uncharacterized protein n=1 Tax=Klebsiella pneumoniae subsp. ozaenae TaxID=574 RepID=A0A378B9D5_KLEPO|nr:hypothetical protein [Klebsiella pneumoniae]STV32477.1 Uncharacterised protein [Klebsiella pneumoniae subsp. ozaenae]VFS43018.1 Uncharacterised protein [Serratia liquefaciens]
MKNIAIKSLYVAGWFTLLSVVMFWASSSDRVHLIFAWMSSETMVMVGFACIPLAIISALPAMWYGLLITVSYSIKFVRNNSK